MGAAVNTAYSKQTRIIMFRRVSREEMEQLTAQAVEMKELQIQNYMIWFR